MEVLLESVQLHLSLVLDLVPQPDVVLDLLQLLGKVCLINHLLPVALRPANRLLIRPRKLILEPLADLHHGLLHIDCLLLQRLRHILAQHCRRRSLWITLAQAILPVVRQGRRTPRRILHQRARRRHVLLRVQRVNDGLPGIGRGHDRLWEGRRVLRLPPGADALVASEALDDLGLGVLAGVDVLYSAVWLLVAEGELLSAAVAGLVSVVSWRWLVEAACDGGLLGALLCVVEVVAAVD